MSSDTNSRRQFLKVASGSLALMGVGPLVQGAESGAQLLSPESPAVSQAPIQRVLSATGALNEVSSEDFNGDDIHLPHEALWNKTGFMDRLGGVPAPSEKRQIVIVGGGMSGLLSGYFLSKNNPSADYVILEQTFQYGGNSKGEAFRTTGGSDSLYTMGAAYICQPDEGSEIESFLNKTGLGAKSRKETDTKVLFQRQIVENFWKNGLSAADVAFFKFWEEKVRDIADNRYPDIPYVESEEPALSWSELCDLDNLSFEQWLQNIYKDEFLPSAGAAASATGIPASIREYFQLYCWSSFGASIDELSAAQALNFLAGEVDGILAFPGGNSMITQYLYEKLNSSQRRTDALVLNVQNRLNSVWVTYYDSREKKLRTIECAKVIMACPKFVAKKLIDNWMVGANPAADHLNYRAYLVGNIILNKKIESPAYDLYSLENEMPPRPGPLNTSKRNFTDTCFSSWPQNDNVNQSVLTIFRALPYDGARQFLFAPGSHEKHKKIILDGLDPMFSALGLTEKNILHTRFTRWGHAVPVAARGIIANGLCGQVRAPIEDRIYFVNQDNWMNPAFETCFQEALNVTGLI